VPLVSGVCRKASAPTLPHGGSRLNASKPEASPKTRCPSTTIQTSSTFENTLHVLVRRPGGLTPNRFSCWSFLSFSSSFLRAFWFNHFIYFTVVCRVPKKNTTHNNTTQQYRIANQVKADLCRPRWRKVCIMITRDTPKPKYINYSSPRQHIEAELDRVGHPKQPGG